MAHQRAGAALRMIVLARRKAVIDEQRDAALEGRSECGDERLRGQIYFGDIPGRQSERLSGGQQSASGGS